MSVSHDDLANAIRFLSIDAVERAKSGHPGLPMGAADIATVLFQRILNFDASHPDWPNRDRFVLSAGHGSMLLYSLVFLTGMPGLSVTDLQNFRQLGSKTPGHPEWHHTVGVETTTGPLGQGLGTAVGMAIAERLLGTQFPDLIDHYTYVLVSDGDLMEGISHEAAGIAGHLRLNKLIVLYDSNHISIDGPISLADSVDQVKRFQACGWASTAIDGHDPGAIFAAVRQAQQCDRPSLILCRTTIGYGAPTKAGTAKAHGEALGAAEVAGTRDRLHWPYEPFVVPEPILHEWRAAGLRGQALRIAWQQKRDALDPAQKAEFERRLAGELPASLDAAIAEHKRHLATDATEIATRKAGEAALKVIAPIVPELITGSADLTGSNNTKVAATPDITPGNFAGRYIHWGVREHGMAAACNGLALHGGLIPSGASFLVFTDYCRPSLRLAALMGLRLVHVFTHDSIGLGEDGPTHQPIEQLASLRAIPNFNVFRPADQTETIECWQAALHAKRTPSILALSRQNLPQVRREFTPENLCAKGAYELAAAQGAAQISIFASGSEVSIALAARDLLTAKGLAVRVVSVPCMDLFFEQDPAYQKAVIGAAPVRVGVEAAVRQGWDPLIGEKGAFVGMNGFGASGPYRQVYAHFNITAEAVANAALAQHNHLTEIHGTVLSNGEQRS
jgi:transketolase